MIKWRKTVRDSEEKRARKPRIFIGSSSESLNIAQAIGRNLGVDSDCAIWNEIVPPFGRTMLEFLLEESGKYDFAIFVYAADDVVEFRGKKYLAARDNVVFEHGLFVAKLGRDRVFYTTPNDATLHIPSDLEGVLHGFLGHGRKGRPGNDVKAFAQQVRQVIKEAQRNDWTKEANQGLLWKMAKIGGAETKSFKWKRGRRLEYEPTHFTYHLDRRNSKAYLYHYLNMSDQNGRFEGPVRASGPVRAGWAYMIFEGVDKESRTTLTGVCLVHVPDGLGPSVGYWMTPDHLPDAFPRGIVFGAGNMAAHKRRKVISKGRRS